MTILIALLAVVGLLANGVIYGVDACAAIVQRSALAALDDATLTLSVGHGHRVADRRFPPVGITGLASAVAAAVAGAFAGRPVVCVAAVVAALALVVWLTIFARVSKPVNTAFVAAVAAGTTPPDARALQARWDSVIVVRVLLQAVAMIGLCVALAAV